MKRISIIPQRDNIEESLRLSREYNANFEYNDFFLPFVLDDEAKKSEIIDFYNKNKDIELSLFNKTNNFFKTSNSC